MSTAQSTMETILSPEEANALPHDALLRNITWLNVTADLRKSIQEERYPIHLAAILKKREGRVRSQNLETETQRQQARNMASADMISKLYRTAEYQGYRNPVHDDPVWAPGAQEETQRPNYKPNKYDGRCPNCSQWVKAEQGKLVKLPDGRWGAEHLECPESQTEAPEAPAAAVVGGLDLSGLPSGYYAVPDGDTRLKVRIAHGKKGSKWDGFTFVSDGAAYGQQQRYGMQKPGQPYRGQITEQLEAIAANPLEAMKAYGRLVGRCGRCNTILEDEASVEAGIGPICASYF